VASPRSSFLLVAAMVLLTALTLAVMRRPGRSVLLSLSVVALSPVLLGQVLTERFDVWPAALTAAALAAAAHGRYRLGGAMLGVGAAAKFYPVLLVPVLAIVVIRQRGVREAIAVAGTAVAATAAVYLPFAIGSYSGTWEAVRVQFGGGLQIESLASSVLVMARRAFERLTVLGLPPPSDLTTRGVGHGLIRTELVGAGVGVTALTMTVLLAAALCVVWLSLARSTADPQEDLLRYAAGTVAVLLALGTVLSPQYVVWLVPLVPLVGGRRGTAATLLLVVAAALTNLWIPARYFEYQSGLAAGTTSILLARNLALLATALVLLLPARALGPFWTSAPMEEENRA
jgi:Glycosyltransferase family 87